MTQSNGPLTIWCGLGLREEHTGGCVVTKQQGAQCLTAAPSVPVSPQP